VVDTIHRRLRGPRTPSVAPRRRRSVFGGASLVAEATKACWARGSAGAGRPLALPVLLPDQGLARPYGSPPLSIPEEAVSAPENTGEPALDPFSLRARRLGDPD
jgi:hypothetical protein